MYATVASRSTMMVGGAIVRSGDLVIDGSLKSGLERLASELAH